MLHSEYVEFLHIDANTEIPNDNETSDTDSMPPLIPIAENTIEPLSQIPSPPKSIYFGGVGCATGYYVGVIKAMQTLWGPNFVRENPTMQIHGDSAGTIFAILLLLDYTAYEIEEIAIQISKNMVQPHILVDGFDYYLDKFILHIIKKHPDILQILNGRFQCGYTTVHVFPIFEYKKCNHFETTTQLIESLRASYNIPLYCKRRDMIAGLHIMDGGFSFDGTHFPDGDETLFVGLSQTCADINYDIIPYYCMIPQPGKPFDFLIQTGFHTMMAWDGSYCKKVDVRVPNYSMLYVFWAIKHIQNLWHFSTDWFFQHISFMSRDAFYDSDSDDEQ